MKNQFWFSRTEGEQTFTDSFNVNKVIRSVMMDDDTLVVLLDDLHERVQEVPNVNLKSNKITGVRKKVEMFQSEIYLKGDDVKRFKELTEIN